MIDGGKAAGVRNETVVIRKMRRRWLEVAIGESNRRRSRLLQRDKSILESFEVRYELTDLNNC